MLLWVCLNYYQLSFSGEVLVHRAQDVDGYEMPGGCSNMVVVRVSEAYKNRS